MPITITPPAAMDTPQKRSAWAHRWIENLRIAHNWIGEWYTGGKTLAQYNLAMGITNPGGPRDNMLTKRLRTVFPYKPQLSEVEWNFFVVKHHQFTMRLAAIHHENHPAQPNLTEAERDAENALVDGWRNDTTLDDYDGTLDEA